MTIRAAFGSWGPGPRFSSRSAVLPPIPSLAISLFLSVYAGPTNPDQVLPENWPGDHRHRLWIHRPVFRATLDPCPVTIALPTESTWSSSSETGGMSNSGSRTPGPRWPGNAISEIQRRSGRSLAGGGAWDPRCEGETDRTRTGGFTNLTREQIKHLCRKPQDFDPF
jgi:hypothetical protein